MGKVRITSKKLSAFLKVDCFEEIQKVRYAGEIEDQEMVTRPDFFNKLYTHVKDGYISMRTGIQDAYRKYSYAKWIEDLTYELNTSVVFIEGYAGCGKSVFVQKILTEVFADLEYEKNYYNYDIGASFESNEQNRIKDAILECFIDQYIALSEKNDNVIDKMEELLAQERIDQLDNARDILYEFSATKAYESAKRILFKEKDETNFKKLIHDQLKKLSTEQVIYIDCIFRLAKYIIVEDEPEIQIICYDNLDAIENNTELCNFDNILLSVKENMDAYLTRTRNNYRGKGTPHFVFIATFRKITAIKVGLFESSERFGDNRKQNEKVYYIDGSHLFDYREMVINRYNFMCGYIQAHTMDNDIYTIIQKMGKVVELFSISFVKTRYAGLWNFNYRTCSDIMECILSVYEPDVDACINLSKLNVDSYDEMKCVGMGASAIFLSTICKVQRDCGYWGTDHLDINKLNSAITTQDEYAKIKSFASLSRLLLTYIMNESRINQRNVSVAELFEAFSPMYPIEEIARILANMLLHDKKGIWRRPIVYTKNVIPENRSIYEELLYQGQLRALGQSVDGYAFTEVTTCDCGISYVSRVVCDFEYYLVRLGHESSLYLLGSIDEISIAIDDVLKAVKDCSRKVNFYRSYYCKKRKNMIGKFEDQMFNPRTEGGRSQLHSERVIFNHIQYLDNYRLYISLYSKFNPMEKEQIRELILGKIDEYLNVYYKDICPNDGRRKNVADGIHRKIEDVKQNPNDNEIRLEPQY